ncbi:PH domain-containing protein [Candidatus Woesearchaeota archaeon]|nr:PH domain-containing protein [Candidatus Woesearchaeota archaeon]
MTNHFKPDILKAALGYSAKFLLVIIIFLIIGSSKLLREQLFIALIVVMFVLGLLARILRLFFEHYELQKDGLVICSGIIAKSRRTILYSKIQDVEESQSLTERILGIAHLEIQTMSESAAKLLYLSLQDAHDLRNAVKNGNKQLKTENERLKTLQDFPEQHNLKKAIALTLSWLILATILGIISIGRIITAPAKMSAVMLFYAFSIILILSFAIAITQIIYSFFTTFSLTTKELTKTYSAISKSCVAIPLSKIRMSIIHEGVIDRILGLCSLKIETGSSPVVHDKEETRKRGVGYYFGNLILNLPKQAAFLLQQKILGLAGIKNAKEENMRNAYPLSSLKPLKKTARTGWYLLVLLSIILASLQLTNTPVLRSLTTIVIAFFSFIIILYAYEYAYFQAYYYTDSSSVLSVRKGVFWISTKTIPYNKIQHVFVDQDIFDRVLGLYDIHLSTASTSETEIHIDGLTQEYAEALKERLLRRTIITP